MIGNWGQATVRGRESRRPIVTGRGAEGWKAIVTALLAVGFAVGGVGCEDGAGTQAPETTEAPAPLDQAGETVDADPAVVALAARARSAFGSLPGSAPNDQNPGSPARVNLGRMLYYDARLSKNHDISCNSCHMLDAYGVDGEPTSPGHRGQRGDRNSPSVYNAALHLAQFWDGRSPDVEDQAKGPVLNPIEMASPSEAHVVAVLVSIPGYVEAFGEAYPDEAEPVTYQNMANAIGAFERNLMTPGRFDAFLNGDLDALDDAELRGLETFLGVGCNSCHTGPAVGGTLYRKLGFIFPYETEDVGREKLTGDAADRHVFKVPSLRNVTKTAPYLHDGSIASLEEMVRIMGYHQVGLQLDDAQIADIIAFLESLTGEIDSDYVAVPQLPESGPDTPAPDPT